VKVIKIYYQGIKEATFQPKIIFVLWFINFIFGFIFFYLFFEAFSRAIGQSAVGEELLRKFEFNFLFEFLAYHAESIATIFSAAGVLILIELLVSTFLFGGILFTLTYQIKSSDLANNKKSFAQLFFQGAGKFFGRFFRLLIYSFLLWISALIVFLLLNLFIGIFTGEAKNEQLFFYSLWLRLAIGLFIFFLVKMILDYTRIKIVTEDSRYVLRSLFKTVKFVFQKLGKALALYYLLVLTGIILFTIYFALKFFLPSNSLITILVVFLVGQLFIASLAWLKIAFQKAQITFYSQQPIQYESH